MKKISFETKMLFTLTALLIMLFPSIGLSQTTAQFASGWTVNHIADWTPYPASPSTNPLGAVDDNCTGGTNSAGGWVEFTFPAFGIPAGDVVSGIEVRVNYLSGGSNTVQLKKGGALVGSSRTVNAVTGDARCSNTAWTTALGAVDLWGTSLTTADFNAGNVGFRLTQNAATVDLDAVEIIAHHAPSCTDMAAPSITCPGNQNVNFNANCQFNLPDYTGATVSDDCDPSPTVTQSPSGGSIRNGQTTVTLTATDATGKSSTCNFEVIPADITKPVITCPSNMNIDSDPGQCSAVVDFTTTATDNCDPNPTITCSPPSGSPFDVGTTIVNCTATDDAGNSASCSFTVTVNDVEDPEITCPNDITHDTDPDVCTAVVTFDDPVTSDNCGVASVDCVPPSESTFSLGTTTVTCTVIDVNGNSTQSMFDITIEDNQDPEITTIAGPIVLWPPNHKYKTIKVTDCVTEVFDNCDDLDPTDVTISSVSSDEPEDVKGGGDGKTKDDMVIAGDCQSVDLRSERQGGGNGRVYTIHLSVTDMAGNVGTAICQVTVPHDQSGAQAEDDGAAAGYTKNCAGSPRLALDSELAVHESVQNQDYVLEQNSPNPFNTSTSISFVVPELIRANLTIYNLRGQRIKTLYSGTIGAGQHTVEWDGTNFLGAKANSGIYMYHLQAGDFKTFKKLILIN